MFLPKDSVPLTLHRAPVLKHMQGKHDQQSHAGGRRAAPKEPAKKVPAKAEEPEFKVGDLIEGATPSGLLAKMLEGKGLSVNFKGQAPTNGYIVALQGYEVKVSDADMRERGADIIFDYLKRFQSALREQAASRTGRGPDNTFFGAWQDEDSGDWYLDVSERYQSLPQAAWVSDRREQLALWDVVNKEPINRDDPLAISAANQYSNMRMAIDEPARAVLAPKLPVDYDLLRAHDEATSAKIGRTTSYPKRPERPAEQPSAWQRTLDRLTGRK